MRHWNETLWRFIGILGYNWLTLFGATLTTISALLMLVFLLMGFLGVGDSPYIGIMGLLVFPALFVLGLTIIPLGWYWGKRRTRKQDGSEILEKRAAFPIVDFNQPRVRHMAAFVATLTIVNLLVISLASYEGVVYMDSVEFCGRVCHRVMEPEYTAYLGSPHARVKCIECHIGPGAPWFVRSKLSGVGQVFAVTFNTYPRPIPTPVQNLRPSREICEECHWPQKFTGDRVRVIQTFSEDKANTPLKTVLLLHVGGGSEEHGAAIHSWHTNPRRQTVYLATDRQRQSIPWVQVLEADGQAREYRTPDYTPGVEQARVGEKRIMDCIDCHNRPTHIFQQPDQAIDEALAAGRLDRSLPYIRKVGVAALKPPDGKIADLESIDRYVQDYYRQNHRAISDAKRQAIETAIREIQAIHARNVFLRMNVTWGTYPLNIGHQRFQGCFRCHDDQHAAPDGRTIAQDCELCHTLLAQEEEKPEVLEKLGIQ